MSQHPRCEAWHTAVRSVWSLCLVACLLRTLALQDDEGCVFFRKMAGDAYRYLAEVQVGDNRSKLVCVAAALVGLQQLHTIE